MNRWAPPISKARCAVTLVGAALVLASSTPIASADDEVARFSVTIDGVTLKKQASGGDVSAVLHAAAAAAAAGLDPDESPLVRELTDLYEHSPMREAYYDVLRQRASDGDISAVLEMQRQIDLAGGGDANLSAFVDELTGLYENGPGRAAWEAEMKRRAGAGDVKAVLDAARASALATGDPNASPLVRTLTQLFTGGHSTSEPSSSRGGGSDASESGGGGREPGEGLPEHSSGAKGGSSGSGGGTPTYSVRCTEFNSTVEHGVTQDTWEVTTTDPDTGTTTVTTTSYDAYGAVVSQTTSVTDADGNTTTTDTTEQAKEAQAGTGDDDDDDEESLTTGDETGAEPDWTALERPTRLDMLGHPMEGGGTSVGEDSNYDGRPDTVAGHLDGHVDPSPEGDGVLLLLGDPAVHLYNRAGPETLPPDVGDPQGTGPSSPDLGNGPIENPLP